MLDAACIKERQSSPNIMVATGPNSKLRLPIHETVQEYPLAVHFLGFPDWGGGLKGHERALTLQNLGKGEGKTA
eukprot:174995-Pelagomonas_calceolata.AAC.1